MSGRGWSIRREGSRQEGTVVKEGVVHREVNDTGRRRGSVLSRPLWTVGSSVQGGIALEAEKRKKKKC